MRDAVLSRAELASLTVVERRRADDGFVKYLFESPLGGRVEAVRIPLFDTKYVVCVSSQVGCALACDFCATGRMGFQRNLQTWEILDQVRQIRAEADRAPCAAWSSWAWASRCSTPPRCSAPRASCAHPAGSPSPARAITFSTAGWVPAIDRYVREGHPYRLAFSVTSAIPEKRAPVLPVERTHPLPELVRGHRRLRAGAARAGDGGVRVHPGLQHGPRGRRGARATPSRASRSRSTSST